MTAQEEEMAEFIVTGPNRERSWPEVREHFLRVGWEMAAIIKALHPLVTNRPRALSTHDNEKGELVYKATKVLRSTD